MIKIDPTLVFLDYRESQKTWDPRERKGQTRIGSEIDPYKS